MFKVSARTVLELGSELISSDIIAFYELVKNSFDAKTKDGVIINFNITLSKNSFLKLKKEIIDKKLSLNKAINLVKNKLDVSSKYYEEYMDELDSIKHMQSFLGQFEEAQRKFNTIEILDTGDGMSCSDLEKKFLVIGTSSRKKDILQGLRDKTDMPYLGEKGIGRLSMMRLANQVSIETAQLKDTKLNRLDIDWTLFDDLDLMIDEIKIEPFQKGEKKTPDWSGCEIKLSNLVDNWTIKKATNLVNYEFSKIVDPFLDLKKRPKISITFNQTRISIPYMNKKLLQHCHAKVIGNYKIVDNKPVLTATNTIFNAGVEHPIEEDIYTLTEPDLIGSIIGDNLIPNDALVSLGEFNFEFYWFNRRLLHSIEGIGDLNKVRELQKQWSGILLFRDQFRVYPYGEDDDDWLSLDRKALSHSGYTLNKTQFVGKIDITRHRNPALIDQTNREGLRETDEKIAFIQILQLIIQSNLLDYLRHVQKQYKNQKTNFELLENTNVTSLEARAKKAVKELAKVTPPESAALIDDLNQTVLEFSEFAKNAKLKLAEYETDSLMVSELAGVGLMSEIIAHELARTSENALSTLSKINKAENISDIKHGLSALRDEMRTLSKRISILDPIVSTKRQRFENVNLNMIVHDVIELHKTKFQRHGIKYQIHSDNDKTFAKAIRGMIVQILSNLIANSTYWMMIKRDLDSVNYQPKIDIYIEDNPPTIIYIDNGTGISPENKDNVFKAFFSLKEQSKRRGLGLYISKENAEYMKGSLVLDSEINKETQRLHTFILELPSIEEK